MAYPSLTLSQIRAASKRLKGAGLKLPACGWSIIVPAGDGESPRRLARDPRGYFWIG
jgi:hypothetical protein